MRVCVCVVFFSNYFISLFLYYVLENIKVFCVALVFFFSCWTFVLRCLKVRCCFPCLVLLFFSVRFARATSSPSREYKKDRRTRVCLVTLSAFLILALFRSLTPRASSFPQPLYLELDRCRRPFTL